MKMENWRITTSPSALTEGLFGQIVLWVFEVLPKLYENRIFPRWQITSLKYGVEPDFTVIPGVFDLNYDTGTVQTKDIDLMHVRDDFARILGNEWGALNILWSTYFRIPSRTVERGDQFGDLNHTLGLHYRGTDKNKDSMGLTNPVSYDDFLTLVTHFVDDHSDINTLFVASDETGIKELVRRNYPGHRVIDTGKVTFWNAPTHDKTYSKADHVVLDCLLLSRCRYLIKNESAMSAFAKVLNPELEAYRMAACKLVWDFPYFPDAYIPPLTSENRECQAILERTFEGDWTQNKDAWRKFGKPFVAMEPPRESTRMKLALTYLRAKSLMRRAFVTSPRKSSI